MSEASSAMRRHEVGGGWRFAYPPYTIVMPGLVPGIHVFSRYPEVVDARLKVGHDDVVLAP